MTQRERDRDAFLAALAEDRYDRAARLVFADWLEENGDRPGDDDLALEQRRWTPERQEAEDWLREFAEECGLTCRDYETSYGGEGGEWVPITFEDVLQAGHDYLDRGDYFTQRGSETARNLMTDERRELYWRHWQTLTGRTLGEETAPDAPFSCSC